MHTITFRIDKQQGLTVSPRELYPVSWDIYVSPSHFAVQQKFTQHYKSTIIKKMKAHLGSGSILMLYQLITLMVSRPGIQPTPQT